MNTPSKNALPALPPVQTERLKHLQVELQHAWDQTSRKDASQWSKDCGMTFVRAGTRRVSNLVRLTRTVVTSTSREIFDGYRAWHADQLGQHMQQRTEAAVQTVKNGYWVAHDLTAEIARAFRDNPNAAGLQLFTLVLTSLVVSGGPDGDGGAPDLDLMLGIDAHRSILSHSILMGTALETGVLSLLLMVKMVHDKLPTHHDPLWDDIHTHAENIASSANCGASIGMAYHLLVDGLAQPAAYHDLPVSMPMEAHQTLFVVNAAGEAIDASNKPRSTSGQLA